MAVLLLTPAAYPDVRAAIQIDLSSDDIPDDIIDQDQFAGAAERQVLLLIAASIPALPTPGTPQYAMLVSAAVAFAAARLVTSVPQLTSERFAAYAYTRQPLDTEKKAKELVQRGLAAIAVVLGLDLADLLRATAFTLADGGRGDISPRSWTSSGGPSFLGPF